MAKFHTPPPYKKTRAFVRAHLKSLIALVFGLGLLGAGGFMVWAATLQIPDLNSIATRRIDQSVTLYDRTGEVALYNLNSNVSRTIVPLADISPVVQNATIAIEDPGFYGHRGIELKAIIRAIVADVVPGGLTQGGSTLTQQVVKNTLLTNKKSIVRKVKEWILAIKLERVLSKNQILELYLNQAPYGGNIYGVESAAQTFFGVRANNLTLTQAAYLAAVLPAPTYYSPYGPHKADLDKRKNLVLNKMFEHGYITATERDAAKGEVVDFKEPHASSITAPHFVFYVQQYLEEKYGQDSLEQNGWKVITTLNAKLQTKAEEVVQARAETNEKNFNATNTGVIALDPTNGNILAMIGSRNYFDEKIDGNYNVTLADRQPGSAFKPFAYAEAFIKGYTPDTVLFDVPTQFSTTCSPEDTTNSKPPCYAPVNYDNKFLGPMTLRDAIAQSRNIPSVKTLYLAGITDTLRLAKAMGISTLGDPNQYGLTLVLGGGEVTLLDMSSAYGVFAQNGMRYQPISVLKIIDSNGNSIEDNSQPIGSQVLPPDAAEKINDILSDPVARAPLGENDLLSFAGHDVAVKTGTTNNYKDAWTIGYTPNLVLGMWVGNNDNTSMVHKVSGFIVGPMWHDIMQYALTETTNQSFTRTEYDTSSLKPVLRGIWQTLGTDNTPHEILYWVDKNNPLGAQPANPQNDSQYTYWEVGVGRWVAQHGVPALLPQSAAPQQTTSADSAN
ncbi:MAG: penicillin-binding protein [Patescibacteria group bacterium]|nr:penicillin-binding protein [Patescibacteria group bacterium]